MTDEIEREALAQVTQADRTALQAYMVERARIAFTGDTGPHADLLLTTLAAHREAAYEAGLKAGAVAERAKIKPVISALHDALAQHTCYGCPACSGDCSSANPPMISCPTEMAIKAFRMFDAIERGEHLETDDE